MYTHRMPCVYSRAISESDSTLSWCSQVYELADHTVDNMNASVDIEIHANHTAPFDKMYY